MVVVRRVAKVKRHSLSHNVVVPLATYSPWIDDSLFQVTIKKSSMRQQLMFTGSTIFGD